ncbi:MAG: cobalamin B12-binding domain-containing protein [Desulfobacteraceae bacterium]|nr:cobalamin B12-binding domain-containing protein [Desulfobacteraceae bacterium]
METEPLRKHLLDLLATWRREGLPSWTQAYQSGQALLDWKTEQQIGGLWERPPQLVTATLDDSIGQGLKMIHLFSEVAGVVVRPLGLMQSSEHIITACHNYKPDMLGLTVLQLDTVEMLDHIAENIPDETHVLVGGPAFKLMPAAQLERKPYHVIHDVAAYVELLLEKAPISG